MNDRNMKSYWWAGIVEHGKTCFIFYSKDGSNTAGFKFGEIKGPFDTAEEAAEFIY